MFSWVCFYVGLGGLDVFWGDCGVLFFVAFCRVWGVGCAVSGYEVAIVCVCCRNILNWSCFGLYPICNRIAIQVLLLGPSSDRLSYNIFCLLVFIYGLK